MNISDARLAELVARTGPTALLHFRDEDDVNAALIELQSARVELERMRAQVAWAWRPIDTAPKDGRTVLLGRIGATRAYTGEYVTAGASGWWRDTHGQQREPTHWMPMPPTPYAAQPNEVAGS